MRSWSVALSLLAVWSAPAFAHENGAIHLASKQVGVGAELSLRGENLPKSAMLRLQLRGVLETFALVEVRTDSAGRFQARFALPAMAKPGTYTVAVLAPDGDVVARAEMGIVEAAAAGGMTAEEHATMDQSGTAAEGPHPTAAYMEVPVSTTGVGWVAIVGLIAASAGLGLALLLRSAPGGAA